MTVSPSSRYMYYVLLADAASCLVAGALQVLVTSQLASLLGLPFGLLAASGWFLLMYGALVGFTATREPVPRALVRLFMAGNLGWALACIALLAGRWLAPTAWGAAWILAQAATVMTLAWLQWTGLRRGQPLGWA